jgi:hypothetical protein
LIVCIREQRCNLSNDAALEGVRSYAVEAGCSAETIIETTTAC